MTRYVAAVEAAAPAAAVWARLTDWPAHGRWVPLTQVRTLTARPDGVGARFLARTGLGPLGFDDPMEVTEWLPPGGERPGRCVVRKLGRVIRGTAAFDVAAVDGGRTLVVWEEDVDITPVRLTRPLTALAAPLGRASIAAVLRAMAREVEAEHAAAGPAGPVRR